VHREGGRIEQTNFDTYNSMRIAEMPKVESIIMPSGGFWNGFGEPTIFVAAPAMLNAFFYGNGPAHPLGPAEEPQHLVRVMKRRGAGADPAGFCLAHMKDARAGAVIDAAANGGWRPDEKGDGSRGHGIAFTAATHLRR
jgi:hypothetical protein